MGKYWIQSHVLLSFLLFYFFSFFTSRCSALNQNGRSGSCQEQIRVRLVLDLDTVEGKMVNSSVSMALSDFYADYKTRISLLALPADGDLLKNVDVEVIIGLLETKFLEELGEKAHSPPVSINYMISLSLRKYNHLIQVTHDYDSEANGITTPIHGFDWNTVYLVYEDDDDCTERTQLMVNHFHEKESKHGFTSEDFLMDQLWKMRDLGTTVFVVHLSGRIATHLFPCAEKLGMMGDGFAWILTAKIMNSLHDDFTNEAMESVVGFKSNIPMSKELHNFSLGWRKSLTQLTISSLWALDIVVALDRAKEVVMMPNGSLTLFNSLSQDFQLDDSMLMYFQPLTLYCITSVAFFVLAGNIVWLIKRSENIEFQGSWPHQIGVVLWFGFSALAYAHRERLKHNLSRVVVIVCVFVVLLFSQLYLYFPSSYQRASYSPIQPDQVFINYRGEQLRYSFVSHLVDAFERHQINFFQDKYELRGKDLKNLFVQIEESKIALAIFSTRYTESRWCMDELVKMKKLVDKGKLQVIPIFYKVKPRDVRKQTGKFGDNFWKLARVSSGDQIKNWKEALECISNKIGLSLKDKYSEADFVKEVVMEVKRVIAALELKKENKRSKTIKL